ncbi:MAG: phosphoribosylaminoimidazolesuccinocarboxamide synthase [Armatimonadota bacterium]
MAPKARITGLNHIGQGKVRDIYEISDELLLLVASDRISAFDVVMSEPIPNKGQVLTQLAAFWFQKTSHIIPNHLVSAHDDEVRGALEGAGGTWDDSLCGRVMLCQRTKPLAVEAVVRGYLSGSGWKQYQNTPGQLWGHVVPFGLAESQMLPQPIYTPSSKATEGHDQPLTVAEAALVSNGYASDVETTAVKLYQFAADLVDPLGLILADTKFEFGVHPDGRLLLIDEALTPDSSRFWLRNQYEIGISPPSFDKQYVRDYLESISGWNKQYPAPTLPTDVIMNTRSKYLDAYSRITGSELIYATNG